MPHPGSDRPVGRPSKLTPSLQAKLAETVAAGTYLQVAARAHGIHPATFHAWMARGSKAEIDEDTGLAVEESEQPYVEFHDAMQKAEAQAEELNLELIQTAAKSGEWRAAAWYLERKAPDRWGRRDHLKAELTGAGGGPVQVDTRAQLLDFLNGRADAMEQVDGEEGTTDTPA